MQEQQTLQVEVVTLQTDVRRSKRQQLIQTAGQQVSLLTVVVLTATLLTALVPLERTQTFLLTLLLLT